MPKPTSPLTPGNNICYIKAPTTGAAYLRSIAAGCLCLAAASALIFPNTTRAHDTTDDTKGCAGTKSFAAHQDNYAVWGKQQNNGWSQSDNAAVRVQYSTKYSVHGCPKTFDESLNATESEVFVSYTGMFDFYARTRDSSPVINRISNLGLHARLPGQEWLHWAGSSLELSLEHRSDGQVFEATTAEGSATAQQQYNAADQKAREFFDTLSRGSNYIGVQVSWQETRLPVPLNLRVKVHGYLSQSSEVTWGPLQASGHTIKNYDVVQLQAETKLPWGYVGAHWRVGTSGLKTDSLDVWWQGPWSVPLYVRAHLGPMNTLSNYTQRQNALGVGLRFSDF